MGLVKQLVNANVSNQPVIKFKHHTLERPCHTAFFKLVYNQDFRILSLRLFNITEWLIGHLINFLQ